MITLNDIAKKIQTELNAEQSGLEFTLHTHSGRFIRAVKKNNEIERKINGLVSLTSSEIEAVQSGAEVASMTVKIDIVVRCKDDEFPVLDITENGEAGTMLDGGNVSYLNQVANTLNDFASRQFSGTMTDAAGKTFALAYSFGLANDGTRDKRPGIGDSFTFTLFGYYNIIQNGVNSKDIKYYLDGYIIPYSSGKMGRQPVIESDVFAGDVNAKATTTSSVFYCTLNVPAFVGDFYKKLRSYILDGDNTVHILTIEYEPNTFKNYFVYFGESSMSVEGVANVGDTVSFSEAYSGDIARYAEGITTSTDGVGAVATLRANQAVIAVYEVAANKWYNSTSSFGSDKQFITNGVIS